MQAFNGYIGQNLKVDVKEGLRGKKLVIIIGQPKALAMAVKNRKSNKRLTKLAARISVRS